MLAFVLGADSILGALRLLGSLQYEARNFKAIARAMILRWERAWHF